MSSLLGTLVVRIAAEMARYKADLNDAAKVTGDAADKIEKSTGRAATAAGRMNGSMGEAARGAQALHGAAGMAGVGVGALAVGLAATAYAAFKGSQEDGAYRKSLILTGNAAGTTAGQMADMARNIDQNVGTTYAAAQALAAMAGTGQVAAASLQKVAQTAVEMERAAVQSVGATVKQFAELGQEPVKASVKLNESMNYLTASTFAQIKAADDLGDREAAAAIAQDAYATAMSSRTAQIVQNLGTLETAWMVLKEGAKEAWDAMLGIGRAQTAQNQLDKFKSQLANAHNTGASDAEIKSLQTQVTYFERMVASQGSMAAHEADQAQRQKAKIAWMQEGDKYLTKAEKMEREIARLRFEGNAAGATELEIEKRIAAARSKGAGPKGPDLAAKAYEQATKSANDFIESLKEETQQTGLSADQVKMLGAARAAAKAPTAALREEIMAQALALSLATTANDAATAAQKEAVKADIDAFKSMDALRIASEKQVESAKGMLFQLEFETRLIGMNADARAMATMERDLETKGIVKGTAAYDDYIARLREAMEIKNATQTVEDTAKKAADEWNKFYDSLYNGLTDSLYRAFEQGGSFFKNFWNGIKNLFKTTVLKLGIQGVVGGVTGMMGMNAANASTGAMGGGGNMLGTAANLSTMYTGISSMVKLGGQVVAGTMSVANALGTAAANATGTGISGLLATNGAYGTATGAAGAAGGFMSSVVTAIPYVAVAALVANALGLFKSKKIVGNGMMGTLGEGDLQSYDLQRKGGSLFSGPSYSIRNQRTSPESQALQDAYNAIRVGTASMADSLGLAGDSILAFKTRLGDELIHPETGAYGIKLDGLTAEQASAKVQAAMESAADKMAQTLLAGNTHLMLAGETASATLQRLSSRLTTTNAWLSMLRNRLFDVSVSGADAASKLTDAFGSLDNLAASSAAYYEQFYSDAERTAHSTEDLAKAMALVNVTMPATKAAFRDVVTGLDLNTEAGRNAYATLLALAPEFAETVDLIQELAAEASESLMKAFTGGGRLIPALDVALLKVGDFTGSTAVMSGELSFINSIMGDSTSRVIAFRNGAYVLGTEMSASQLSAQMLHEQIADLGDAADSARIDFNGLVTALASVNTETFVATVALVFENLAERIRGVLDDIGSERIAVREAALQIINPTVMGKAQIQAGIAGINTALPGGGAAQAASSAAIQASTAENAAKTRLNQSIAAKRLMDDSAAGLSQALATAVAARAKMEDATRNMATIAPELSREAPGSFWDNRVYESYANPAYAAAQQGVTTAKAEYESASAEAARLAGVVNSTFNANKAAASQLEVATRAVSAATAARAAADNAAKAATLAYASALQDFAIDAGKSVNKVTRLREETVKYYEQQKQLADLMGKSAAGLRTTVADYRYKQLTDAQQLGKLQEQFSSAYSLARATSGDVMAGYGDKLNALLPALIDKLGETGNTGLIASYLAQAESVAGLIEAAVPVNYQQDSLSMLGSIDATLAALDASSQSAEKIISAAVNAGSDRTAAGLHAVVAALTGQSIPAFAAGGSHAGGLRIVGEQGWELESTGPSQIFNQQQLGRALSGGGNSARLEALVERLTQEVTRQGYELRAIATSNAQMARLAKRQDDDGMLVRTDSDTPLNVEVAP